MDWVVGEDKINSGFYWLVLISQHKSFSIFSFDQFYRTH